jgi:hypothetical protein
LELASARKADNLIYSKLEFRWWREFVIITSCELREPELRHMKVEHNLLVSFYPDAYLGFFFRRPPESVTPLA